MTLDRTSLLRVALATVSILLLPLVAMQFTEEVDWNAFDFIVMGTLLSGTGLACELLVKSARGKAISYRVALVAVPVGALLLIWAQLAVGVV